MKWLENVCINEPMIQHGTCFAVNIPYPYFQASFTGTLLKPLVFIFCITRIHFIITSFKTMTNKLFFNVKNIYSFSCFDPRLKKHSVQMVILEARCTVCYFLLNPHTPKRSGFNFLQKGPSQPAALHSFRMARPSTIRLTTKTVHW